MTCLRLHRWLVRGGAELEPRLLSTHLGSIAHLPSAKKSAFSPPQVQPKNTSSGAQEVKSWGGDSHHTPDGYPSCYLAGDWPNLLSELLTSPGSRNNKTPIELLNTALVVGFCRFQGALPATREKRSRVGAGCPLSLFLCASPLSPFPLKTLGRGQGRRGMLFLTLRSVFQNARIKISTELGIICETNFILKCDFSQRYKIQVLKKMDFALGTSLVQDTGAWKNGLCFRDFPGTRYRCLKKWTLL